MSDWIKAVLKWVAPWQAAIERRGRAHLAQLEALPLEQARRAALDLLAAGAPFKTELRGRDEPVPGVPDPNVRELLERYRLVWGPDMVFGGEVREVPDGFWLFGYAFGGEVRLLVRISDSWIYQDDTGDPKGPRRWVPSVFHYILSRAFYGADIALPTPGKPLA